MSTHPNIKKQFTKEEVIIFLQIMTFVSTRRKIEKCCFRYKFGKIGKNEAVKNLGNGDLMYKGGNT